MAYNLQIAERANDQIDKLTVYVVGVFHTLENYIVKVEDFT